MRKWKVQVDKMMGRKERKEMETGGLSEILMKLEFSWPEHTKPSNSGRDGRWASFCFSSTILLSQKKHRVIFIVSFLLLSGRCG
jgi:hypothetical protein